MVKTMRCPLFFTFKYIFAVYHSSTTNPLISYGDWAIVNAKDVGIIKAVAVPYQTSDTILTLNEIMSKRK